MQEEIWKDILGYEGIYQISNFGRVKSLERKVKGGMNNIVTRKERILKKYISINGYNFIRLLKNKKYYNITIHRLVAKYFIDNPDNKPQINHKDGDKLNNNINNLEWVTAKENMRHAWDSGLIMPHITNSKKNLQSKQNK